MIIWHIYKYDYDMVMSMIWYIQSWYVYNLRFRHVIWLYVYDYVCDLNILLWFRYDYTMFKWLRLYFNVMPMKMSKVWIQAYDI